MAQMRLLLAAVFCGVVVSVSTPILAGRAMGLGLVAQTPGATGLGLANELSAVAQLGVAGALLWVLKWAQTEKKEMRDANAKREERWDVLERLRHEDSEKLNDTLRDMSRRCTETMTKRGE